MWRKLFNTIPGVLLAYCYVIALGAGSYSVAEHKSFWAALWWAQVTALTVGYGDMYPVTLMGRIDATLIMFAGVFLVATMTALIIKRVLVDADVFTNAEQEEIKTHLKTIAEQTKSHWHPYSIGNDYTDENVPFAEED